MTAKAALALALLEGKVLNVKNVFKEIGLTNCAREISRMIENPKTGFGVIVSRTPRKGKNRYGGDVTWIDYRLNNTIQNAEGRAKMIEYIKAHTPSEIDARTESELKIAKQLNLL